jgi:hypothetical protein
MATKAELYRYRQERSKPNRPKRPRRRRRDVPVDTALPGVSATDRKVGAGSTAARNRSRSAARKTPYMLEDSRTRPSRRSTRRGANKQRQDVQLRKKAQRAVRSPTKRAARSRARTGRRAKRVR